MPLFDGDNPDHWVEHYTWANPARPLNGIDVSRYARYWGLIQAEGVLSGDRVIIGGAGRGHTIEAAHTAGFANVWGIDNSTILGSGRFTLANGVLMVDRIMQGGGGTLARLRAVTGDDIFDWVVTEDLLNCYSPTDPDLGLILAACETVLTPGKPLTNIVHLLSCDWDEKYLTAPGTSQSISEWAALEPAHTWIEMI